MQQDYNQDKEIKAIISRLKRAFMTDDYDLQAQTRVALLEHGNKPAQPLLDELANLDLSKIDRSESLKLAVGLAHTLHDVDEHRSAEFIDAALEGNCHQSIAAAFRTIRRFESAKFRETKVGDTLILEQISVDPAHRASSYVIKWLGNLPPNDVRDISRVYIMSNDLPRDYAGEYNTYFEAITIVWREDFRPNLMLNWLVRLSIEFTFYHEVGHHFFRHREGGQVPEQEKEADFYRSRYFRKAHPFAYRFAKSVRWMLRPVGHFISAYLKRHFFRRKSFSRNR